MGCGEPLLKISLKYTGKITSLRCKPARMLYNVLLAGALSAARQILSMAFDAMEQLRTDFRDTFEAYTLEGRRMANLLLTRNADSSENLRAIAEQQARLTGAQRRYDEARIRYIRAVLPDCLAADPGNPAEASD